MNLFDSKMCLGLPSQQIHLPLKQLSPTEKGPLQQMLAIQTTVLLWLSCFPYAAVLARFCVLPLVGIAFSHTCKHHVDLAYLLHVSHTVAFLFILVSVRVD